MSKAGEKIIAGLEEAHAYVRGEEVQGVQVNHVYADPDVTKLRRKVGMSQDKFASTFGMRVGTLRERGGRGAMPGSPAGVYRLGSLSALDAQRQ